MITKYGNGAVAQMEQCLNAFTMLPVKESFEARLFGQISNHVFRSA